MTRYMTRNTVKVPIGEDRMIGYMHRDAFIVVEVTRIPWESGDPDERMRQAVRFMKADAEAEGEDVTWKYTGKPIAFDPSWWPGEMPKK